MPIILTFHQKKKVIFSIKAFVHGKIMAQFSTINLRAMKKTQCLLTAFIRCSSSFAPQIKHIQPLQYGTIQKFTLLHRILPLYW